MGREGARLRRRLCRRVVKGKVQRVQKVVVSPLRGDEYICRLSANPFRLAALATHPLDRGGQGRYVLTFPPDTVILHRSGEESWYQAHGRQPVVNTSRREILLVYARK